MKKFLKDLWVRLLNGIAIGYNIIDIFNISKTFLVNEKRKIKVKRLHNKALPDHQIIIISLNFRCDRRKVMKKRLKKLGLNYFIFDAIYGKNLSAEDLQSFGFSRNSIKYLSDGSKGCIISHIKIWDQLVKSKFDNFVVFEDDIVLSDDFQNLHKFYLEVPLDYDIIFLGSGSMEKYKIKKFLSKHVFIPLIFRNGFYGYIISNNGAKKLLQNIFPIKITCGGIDTIVGMQILKRKLNAYHFYPSLCQHDNTSPSNIYNISKPKKVLHPFEINKKPHAGNFKQYN